MKKTLLKKLLLVILTIGILIPPLPLQGNAAASKITSKKNVHYSMDIVKTSTTYNVFGHAPYNTPGAKKLGNSVQYIGKKYQAVNEWVTDNKRTWVNFKDMDGKTIGWVDKKAIKQGADFRKITSQKDVNYFATITRKSDGIYSKGPHNTPGAKKVGTSAPYYNFSLQVRREIVTDNKVTWLNIYSFIGSTYKEVGWIDKAGTKLYTPLTYVDKPVSYKAIIAKGNDNIYKGDWNPVNGSGTEYDINGYISNTVHVSKERILKSSAGETKYLLIAKDGKQLGWIKPEHLTTYLTEDSKVAQVENVIQTYLKLNNKAMKINSEAFVNFATEQLLEDSDNDLAEREDYDIITAYLSEYLHKHTSTPSEKAFPEGEQTESSVDLDDDLIEEPIIDDENLITPEPDEKAEKKATISSRQTAEISDKKDEDKSPLIAEQNTTIRELNRIAEEEEIENNDIVESDITAFRAKGYNRKRAIAYAKKWGKHRNKNYRREGADCTNFVSQCVYNGRMSEKVKKPVPRNIYKTESYWYSQHVHRVVNGWTDYHEIAVSSSWINVSDFAAYWSKRKPVRSFKNVNSTISYARPGDIIQFKKKGGKRYYHSMIATQKSNKTLYMAGHSQNYYKRNIKAIKQKNRISIRVIKF
ncbi:Putative amidase domain [Listeria grayi]|uniref:GW dipeptide domain-containing protein n=1 Tax=Listeria grayi TaxID=1641 RepID=UPI000F6D0771|nr:amidase domain-containing protein [Listeria grayi]VEI32875.1 Putative amidase domain [Listeria grayi]